METIKFGKYVSLAYEIFVVDGGKETSVFKFSQSKPDSFVYGLDQTMIDAFMKHIEGKAQGDTFDFMLTPEEAFGDRKQELVMTFGKKMFEHDGEFDRDNVYEGAAVPMRTEQGMIVTGRVTTITATEVTLDFNHPLAGETIHYVGQVLLVRDATPSELNPKHGGCEGCGGSCGHEGGCEGCSGSCD